MVPYLIWSSLWIAYNCSSYLIGNLLSGKEIGRNLPSALFVLTEGLGLLPWKDPWLFPLWYLRNLFLLCLCSFPLVTAIGKSKKTGLSWIALVACCYAFFPFRRIFPAFLDPRVGGFFSFCFSLEGLFYFSIGIFLCQWPGRCQWTRRTALLGLLLSGVAFFSTGVGEILEASWYPYPRWLVNPIALYSCWSLIPGVPWPRRVTSMSFPIYCIHQIVLWSVYVLTLFLGIDGVVGRSFAGFLFVTFLGVSISMGVTLAFRRLAPRLSAICFGGR